MALPSDVLDAIATLLSYMRAPGPTPLVIGHDWVDSRGTPFSRREFLKLAREGAFPAFKPSKKVVARRADVDAYIASKVYEPPKREGRATTSTDPVGRALAAGK